MLTERQWSAMFTESLVQYTHDKNPRRPYLRLTSGLISNGGFNSRWLQQQDPHLFGLACNALWNMVPGREKLIHERLRVVGAATGGIAMTSRIAEPGRCLSGYADKEGERLVLKFPVAPEEVFLLVDDTITTAGTLGKLFTASEAVNPNIAFAEAVLTFCNRSGEKEVSGIPIYSLVSPTWETWEEGSNPFTRGGKELVTPIEKPKANWYELIRDY